MRIISTLLLVIAAIVWPLQAQDKPYCAPQIWDEAKLKDWELPLANGGPARTHLTEKEYYSSPVLNLQTYPVYHPDREPAGYLDRLRNLDPRPLVEIGKARTKSEWIELGRRVYREMSPALLHDGVQELSWLSNRELLKNERIPVEPDGVLGEFRWVVKKRGLVQLAGNECMDCHTQYRPDGSTLLAAQGNTRPTFTKPFPIVPAEFLNLVRTPKSPVDLTTWPLASFAVPWLADDKHLSMERISTNAFDHLMSLAVPYTFARPEGSPFWMTRIPDLRSIKHQRFLDATATHWNREPADTARYAALVMYADSGVRGPYHFVKDRDKRPAYHLPDDTLYAIAEYLWSLEPPANPRAGDIPPALVARGKEIFKEENCARCHSGPAYGGKKLTLAKGYSLPADHPAREFILERSVGTDPGLALKTRKGTGLYKVPSLRGLWYRPLLGHSGWVNSLEDWFNPKRLEKDFKLTGWIGPEGSPRAVPGHTYGTDLPEDDRKALIAFLRTL
jgi:hypothetical protein